jgi:YrbI family 3-deoxy-D-manno-octulosonate 8-phosphate phosphatase
MTEFYLGVKKKENVLEIIKKKNGFRKEEIAYIGDDSNDFEVMQQCGFTATPADGMDFIKEIADYICETRAGYGAFREFAELIMAFKLSTK